ncbi:MAG: peptidylprolyl isomerase [Deltaproteobacteria bacterium]|nr:MAG: peptidylprolyl isomerase [Deltaproteobacteria bacterium]
MSQTIQDGMVGMFHYTLTNDAGETLDSSDGGDPLAYLHGTNSIVPGLERQLEGRSVGDAFVAHVPPAEGYGERRGPGPQRMERSAFPADFPVQVGRPFGAQTEDGQQIMLWIVGIDGDEVLIDIDHPLAGQTLHFDVSIVGVRDATEAEKQHGHAHGVDGAATH